MLLFCEQMKEKSVSRGSCRSILTPGKCGNTSANRTSLGVRRAKAMPAVAGRPFMPKASQRVQVEDAPGTPVGGKGGYPVLEIEVVFQSHAVPGGLHRVGAPGNHFVLHIVLHLAAHGGFGLFPATNRRNVR